MADTLRPRGPDNPYGAAHQRTRKQWAPLVSQGRVACRRASNGTCIAESLLIRPDEAWQLGHPDETCPSPLAPEHAICNLRTNARERRAARAAKRRRSRDW